MADNVDNYAAVDALPRSGCSRGSSSSPGWSSVPWGGCSPACGAPSTDRGRSRRGATLLIERGQRWTGKNVEPRRRGSASLAARRRRTARGCVRRRRRLLRHATTSGPQELVGLFRIDAGACADAEVTGPLLPDGAARRHAGRWPVRRQRRLALRGQDVEPVLARHRRRPPHGGLPAAGRPRLRRRWQRTSAAIVMPQKWFAVAFGSRPTSRTRRPASRRRRRRSPPTAGR